MKFADFLWLFTGVALNAGAQLGLKSATASTGAIQGSPGGLWQAGLGLAGSASFWLALGAYALSLVVWIVGLSRVPVSQAYPLLSLGYIITALCASMFFGESLGLVRWLGICVIIVGVWMLTRTST
jgi:multidrug transporter EmrE-like cation transporter